MDWLRVARELAGHTRVCTYDRPGVGWSEPAPCWESRSAGPMADELHDLLQAAGVPAPYVLGGHSSDGYIVRVFATRHSELVAGVVLVDSSHPDQDIRFQDRPATRADACCWRTGPAAPVGAAPPRSRRAG
jgi:pimeloyl-ACP methyl ester carboxylesterase